MRIRDLHDGFVDSFKQGYNKTSPVPGAAPTPAADKKQSVFSLLDPRDTKTILANIINGQPLDSRQMSLLKKIYSRL